ncbi:TatD family hydrolase [Oceanobacillus saliphilus]|uniref:TatD family hydrolase n=1 Tax=Oceanobacillus saliphilus TaxID=2925834 RepID=UPI00201DEC45|nr:TatD family hydrolase [Oceanobacillus saliphilus]
MFHRVIDAHVHLDLYEESERVRILREMDKYEIDTLITVSNDLTSARKNLELARDNGRIKAAFGFHPEQALPEERELEELLGFIEANEQDMVAIGEVGLPYYMRKEEQDVALQPYLELLEKFIQVAKRLEDKPIVLHAVYEDAPLVCSLLEKHSIKKAHFHWFKGDPRTVERMKENGYLISVTPDVVYEREIQSLVKDYPLTQMMVETDGPWPFEGPFTKQMTHPKMIHETIEKIAHIKNVELEVAYKQIYKNTTKFYEG